MVDNRSAGFYGIGGGFNFKSGDASGQANKTSDDKMGQGGEYFAQGKKGEQEFKEEAPYVDRSAQLRASLDSLAALNTPNISKKKLAQVIKERQERDKKKKSKRELLHLEDDTEKTY